MRMFASKPAIMGWQLSDQIKDNRSVKEELAGVPEQLVVTFDYYIQRFDPKTQQYLARDFNQKVQYPGSAIYTRQQVEKGVPSYRGISRELQKQALALFDVYEASKNNIVELKVRKPHSIPERVAHQMAATVVDPALNMRG